MHTNQSTASDDALTLVKREARRLHRAARNASLSKSLPVLRRLMAAAVFDDSLVALQRQREHIQRKHLLRLLAYEAGFASWEHYHARLKTLPADRVCHYEVARHAQGQLNHWFPNMAAARRYAAQHGGEPVAVGEQAVIFVPQ